MICILKLHFLGFFWKHLRALHALEDLEPLLEFPIHLSVRKSRENYRQIYVKSKASLWRNLSTGTPPKLFRTILCTFNNNLQLYIFRTAVFSDGNYSTLDSHTNTALPTRQDGVENRDKVYYYSVGIRAKQSGTVKNVEHSKNDYHERSKQVPKDWHSGDLSSVQSENK